jgi:hypothetical protein
MKLLFMTGNFVTHAQSIGNDHASALEIGFYIKPFDSVWTLVHLHRFD